MMVPAITNTVKDLRIPAAKLHADMVLVYSVDTSLLVDVRTGYICGTTEATDIQEQRASVWSTKLAIETARAKAEKNAFEGFVGEFEELWGGVVDICGDRAAARHGDDVIGNRYFTIQLESTRR